MNIFAVHEDPAVAANLLCNTHVVKMTLESAQMLATALRNNGATDEQLSLAGVTTKAGKPYASAHSRHPCTIWAGQTRASFDWLLAHALSLAKEYTLWFGKVHACVGPIVGCGLLVESGTVVLPSGPMPPFAQAMPDQFKVPGDHVSAYRAYYRDKMDEWVARGEKPMFRTDPPRSHFLLSDIPEHLLPEHLR